MIRAPTLLAGLLLPAAGMAETVSIGALTLPYDTATWHAEARDGGEVLLRCGAPTCNALSVSFAVADGTPEGCTPETMVQAAREKFPDVPRMAVNRRQIGELSVVLLTVGPEDIRRLGRAVMACAFREGRIYGIATEDADWTRDDDRVGVVTDLIASLEVPAPIQHELRFGAFAVTLSGDRWLPPPEGGRTGFWSLTCLPPTCEKAATLLLSAQSATVDASGDGGCLMAAPDAGWRRGGFDAIAVPGPDGAAMTQFVVTGESSMCRAMSPPKLTACAIHDGLRYTVGTTVTTGCNRGRPYVPENVLLDFIRSIRFVGATP